ncbi:ABC transporter permease [uncultured Litoreibacter sp.]|uniref:ABC transporter permease n=1 Tax=uncultured Litoreibacter sp. TaxID=1392394 RepID=UPI00262591FE|nr:ABC transporter permease [uncultured Litoreibacter sp.]
MASDTWTALPRFRTARAIIALVLREMSSTYGRSPGGYIWALLEPIGAIAVLSFVFSYAFRAPGLGTNFPLFYATAFLPYMMFLDVSTKVAQSILFSRQFLSYPSVTFIDALVARFLLNIITHIMVFYVVIVGIHWVFDFSSIIDYKLIFLAFIVASFFAMGVGVVNCFLFTMFPVWQSIWGILMRPMFIVSGVFFLFEDVPTELRDYLWFNPLIHITGLMRAAFYPTYDASYVSLTFLFLTSAVLLSLGLVLLRRFYRDLIER